MSLRRQLVQCREWATMRVRRPQMPSRNRHHLTGLISYTIPNFGQCLSRLTLIAVSRWSRETTTHHCALRAELSRRSLLTVLNTKDWERWVALALRQGRFLIGRLIRG